MFGAAALVLEEIAPEDKNRNEVLGERVNLHMVAKKWDMAAAVASHPVKVHPETAGWWISAKRTPQGSLKVVEKREEQYRRS